MGFKRDRNPECPLTGSPICVKFGRTVFCSCILYNHGFCTVGHLSVKAFFVLRTSSPPSCYPTKLPMLYAMCHLSSNFRTLHPSVFVCTGAECRLDKAEYQQWAMKLALIDCLKDFQWHTVKQPYGSNQCTKTGDIHENQSFRLQKGSQVCLL
jgi:hypothetical protein